MELGLNSSAPKTLLGCRVDRSRKESVWPGRLLLDRDTLDGLRRFVMYAALLGNVAPTDKSIWCSIPLKGGNPRVILKSYLIRSLKKSTNVWTKWGDQILLQTTQEQSNEGGESQFEEKEDNEEEQPRRRRPNQKIIKGDIEIEERMILED
ncbi:hypothetical protein CR513_19593, partial [Mucuna pruriens]